MAIPVAAETKLWTVKPAICSEIAQRGLAAVILPIGVGGEADRGVQRQIRRHSGHALRIPRQIELQPQHGVERHETDEIEQQHGNGIGQPMLFVVRHSTPEIR